MSAVAPSILRRRLPGDQSRYPIARVASTHTCGGRTAYAQGNDSLLIRPRRPRADRSGSQVLLRLLAVPLRHRLPSIRHVEDALVVDPVVDRASARRRQVPGSRRPHRGRARRA